MFFKLVMLMHCQHVRNDVVKKSDGRSLFFVMYWFMGKRSNHTSGHSTAHITTAHFDPALHAPAYNARFEHDACGMGFVADLSGRDTHKILDDALRCLERLAHRGAFDADGKSGDGAGILSAIPHTLLNRELERVGQRAHRPGDVAVGMMFLPRAAEANAAVRRIINDELSRRQLPSAA
jgi:hypothetical protein